MGVSTLSLYQVIYREHDGSFEYKFKNVEDNYELRAIDQDGDVMQSPDGEIESITVDTLKGAVEAVKNPGLKQELARSIRLFMAGITMPKIARHGMRSFTQEQAYRVARETIVSCDAGASSLESSLFFSRTPLEIRLNPNKNDVFLRDLNNDGLVDEVAIEYSFQFAGVQRNLIFVISAAYYNKYQGCSDVFREAGASFRLLPLFDRFLPPAHEPVEPSPPQQPAIEKKPNTLPEPMGPPQPQEPPVEKPKKSPPKRKPSLSPVVTV